MCHIWCIPDTSTRNSAQQRCSQSIQLVWSAHGIWPIAFLHLQNAESCTIVPISKPHILKEGCTHCFREIYSCSYNRALPNTYNMGSYYNGLVKHDATNDIQRGLFHVLTYPELCCWQAESFLVLLIRTGEVHRTILTTLYHLSNENHSIAMYFQVNILWIEQQKRHIIESGCKNVS